LKVKEEKEMGKEFILLDLFLKEINKSFWLKKSDSCFEPDFFI